MVFLFSSVDSGSSFISISLLVLELWQFLEILNLAWLSLKNVIKYSKVESLDLLSFLSYLGITYRGDGKFTPQSYPPTLIY